MGHKYNGTLSKTSQRDKTGSMVWHCLIISAKFPANLFSIHSSQMFPRVEKGSSCSAENKRLSALRLRLYGYFISAIQIGFDDGVIGFKGASFTTEIKNNEFNK